MKTYKQILKTYAAQTGVDYKELLSDYELETPSNQDSFMNTVLQQGGDAVSRLGYSDDSPFRNKKSNHIKSNKITMSNTGIPLVGVSDTGDMKFMSPYSGEHEFDGNSVMEYPIGQIGISLKELKEKYAKKVGIDVNKLPQNIDKQGLLNLALINQKKLNDESFIEELKNEINPKKEGRFLSNGLEYNKIFKNKNPSFNRELKEVVVKAKKLEPLKNSSFTDQMSGNYIPKDIVKQQSFQQKGIFNPGKGWNEQWRNSGLIPKNVWDGLSNAQKQDFVHGLHDLNGDGILQPNENINGVSNNYLKRTSFDDGKIGNETKKLLPTNLPKRKIDSSKWSANMFTATPEENDIQSALETPPNQTVSSNGIPIGAFEIGKNYSNDAVNSTSRKDDEKNQDNVSYQSNRGINRFFDGIGLSRALQPQALPYRALARVKSSLIPNIDVNPYLQEVDNSLEQAISNVNMNSTVGMAYGSGLLAEGLKQKRNLQNQINQQNQQISAQNQQAVTQALNQERQMQNQYDSNYYESFLQGSAARDTDITQALNQIRLDENSSIKEDNQIESLKAMLPYLQENTSVLDKIRGKRKLGINEEKWSKFNTNIPQGKYGGTFNEFYKNKKRTN